MHRTFLMGVVVFDVGAEAIPERRHRSHLQLNGSKALSITLSWEAKGSFKAGR